MGHYVTIKSFPHFGEHAALIGNVREVDGVQEAEVILMDCQHGDHRIWIRKEDI